MEKNVYDSVPLSGLILESGWITGVFSPKDRDVSRPIHEKISRREGNGRSFHFPLIDFLSFSNFLFLCKCVCGGGGEEEGERLVYWLKSQFYTKLTKFILIFCSYLFNAASLISFNSLENGLNMHVHSDSVDNIRDLSYCTKNFTCLIHSIHTHFFFIFLC